MAQLNKGDLLLQLNGSYQSDNDSDYSEYVDPSGFKRTYQDHSNYSAGTLSAGIKKIISNKFVVGLEFNYSNQQGTNEHTTISEISSNMPVTLYFDNDQAELLYKDNIKYVYSTSRAGKTKAYYLKPSFGYYKNLYKSISFMITTNALLGRENSINHYQSYYNYTDYYRYTNVGFSIEPSILWGISDLINIELKPIKFQYLFLKDKLNKQYSKKDIDNGFYFSAISFGITFKIN